MIREPCRLRARLGPYEILRRGDGRELFYLGPDGSMLALDWPALLKK